MRSSWALRISTALTALFLVAPLAVIVVYAFSGDEGTFSFPPTSFTVRWFGRALARDDVREALWLSVRVASAATLLALLLGTLAAFALARSRFFGRDVFTLAFVLPIALPGIVTGIALLSAFRAADIEFGTLTMVVGHATFCMIVVYNNAVARLRRLSPSLVEASLDLGADPLQTFRHVTFPQLRSALLAGALLSFALSFDEVIVTTFTAGKQATLPIWFLSQLFKPRDRPITNVVAVVVVILTLAPMALAFTLSRSEAEGGTK
jgi:putative spermidine/putrescine transport system permease protein